MSITQWVNLPKSDVFKDKEIDSTDRCGSISIEVEVEKADIAVGYRARITPVGNDNVTYNLKEEQRNPNFKMSKGIVGVVDGKKIRVDSINLPTAGGNKYKIEVEDSAGNIVSSPVEVTTKRKMYYQIISMADSKGNNVLSYSLSNMENDAKKHFIDVVKKGSEGKIPYIKTLKMHKIGSNLNSFGYAISKAFTLDKEIKKVGVAAVFSEYIASMSSYEFKQTVVIGVNNPYVAWDNYYLYIAGDRYLWFGLDDADDAIKTWFIDGYISHNDLKTNKSAGYFVNRSIVNILGNKNCTYGGYHQIKIKLDESLKALLNNKQGQIDITLEVNVVDGWTNGFSWRYDNNDLITCARRTVWEDMPANTRDYTWNHEIGHRFGMTAWGNSKHGNAHLRNKLPDAPSTLYGENRGVNDKSHSGPHCEKGASYNSATKVWSGTPGCVMFGANGIGNKHSPKEYCSECTPIVRKLDLTG